MLSEFLIFLSPETVKYPLSIIIDKSLFPIPGTAKLKSNDFSFSTMSTLGEKSLLNPLSKKLSKKLSNKNGLTLLLGIEGGMNLSFLLRNSAVEYLISSNWENDFPKSEYNASWDWVSNEINGAVYAIHEDIENSNISPESISEGIKIISNDEVSSIIEKNDVIFVY